MVILFVVGEKRIKALAVRFARGKIAALALFKVFREFRKENSNANATAATRPEPFARFLLGCFRAR